MPLAARLSPSRSGSIGDAELLFGVASLGALSKLAFGVLSMPCLSTVLAVLIAWPFMDVEALSPG